MGKLTMQIRTVESEKKRKCEASRKVIIGCIACDPGKQEVKAMSKPPEIQQFCMINYLCKSSYFFGFSLVASHMGTTV